MCVSDYVCVSEIVIKCVCVCVNERERERELVSVCMHACERVLLSACV